MSKKYHKTEVSGENVRAKKHLGQHFLKDLAIAQNIADTLTEKSYETVLEIGPGMGVLTQFLIGKYKRVIAVDVDRESIAYLNTTFKETHEAEITSENFEVKEADFLKMDVLTELGDGQFAIIGNYPYNISSQIVFKMLELRNFVPEFSGMFQKEVAQRICAGPGSKVYGILSVLSQAYYEAEYLFTVQPGAFNPPPKVESGVLRLKRKANFSLDCDEKQFKDVVKTAFNQRRKTLRNSLKKFDLSVELKEDAIFAQRPEQLSVSEFVSLTQKIEADAISTH
ncbi:16S rRNA (adenine(1518)-N(6)/adenine(1519)-N(6))-dimethyltransferase RsmA [Psychroflexus planctonicus]|uniref:Ribosomal RNA small subunit methyltransferase A n=1 Tax=Psychroflexus planctonicus TaxID=1526575 RepID=A0ABQ1SKV9_9FLAO|nr:16S rRNA (adenine(1518)-N(6)/adenine(1519)-N(6))-dimethyltransferase RsmA [Psychroflexus planctonicus]GGE40236.1 ribosomal RNA small subunit methyltransferase A [Psychroflexus planctonicus]